MKRLLWAPAALGLILLLWWGLGPGDFHGRNQSAEKPPLSSPVASPGSTHLSPPAEKGVDVAVSGSQVTTPDPRSSSGPRQKSGSWKEKRHPPAMEYGTASTAFGLSEAARSPSGPAGMDNPVEDPNALKELLNRLQESRDRDDTDEETPPAEPLFFTSLLPDQVAGPLSIQARFAPDTGRIYAVFSSETKLMTGQDTVLVRWYDPNGDILWAGPVRIQPGMPFNYIWYENTSWDPGTYQVGIQDIDGSDGLLAAGSYTVEQEPDHIGNLTVVADRTETFTRTDFGVEEPVYLRFPYSTTVPLELGLLVYKIETGETFIDETVTLDPADREYFSLLKGKGPLFPPGSYDVELWQDDNILKGRVRFFLQ